MKSQQKKDLIAAIATGNEKQLNDVYEEITAKEVSAENILLSLHYLKNHGRPEGWEQRELLFFYTDPFPIDDECITLAAKALEEYGEHNDYIKLLRGRYEIIMEGMECYFTLRDTRKLHLLEQYKHLV